MVGGGPVGGDGGWFGTANGFDAFRGSTGLFTLGGAALHGERC